MSTRKRQQLQQLQKTWIVSGRNKLFWRLMKLFAIAKCEMARFAASTVAGGILYKYVDQIRGTDDRTNVRGESETLEDSDIRSEVEHTHSLSRFQFQVSAIWLLCCLFASIRQLPSVIRYFINGNCCLTNHFPPIRPLSMMKQSHRTIVHCPTLLLIAQSRQDSSS